LPGAVANAVACPFVYPGWRCRFYVDDNVPDRVVRMAGQTFLRERIWPTMRRSALTHDSQFAFGERRDFPLVGRLLPRRVIGNWASGDGRG
jgi:hypothetical protein